MNAIIQYTISCSILMDVRQIFRGIEVVFTDLSIVRLVFVRGCGNYFPPTLICRMHTRMHTKPDCLMTFGNQRRKKGSDKTTRYVSSAFQPRCIRLHFFYFFHDHVTFGKVNCAMLTQ